MLLFITDLQNTLSPSSPSLPTSVGVAIVSGYVLNLLKGLKSIPKISYYSTRLNMFLRILMSGIGTLGVTWVWSQAGEGHQLLITIPAWSAIGLGAWHWFIQYGMLHGFEGILQIQKQMDTNGTLPGDKVA